MSKLLRKRRLVWLLALTLLVMLAVAGYFSGKRYLAAAEWVTHTFDVSSSINEVVSRVQDLENGQRGYLLSGREPFLEPYAEARRTLPAAIERLQNLVQDNARQRIMAKRLMHAVERKAAFAAGAIQIKRQGGDFVHMVQTDRGRLLMLEVKRLAKSMLDEERQLLSKRTIDAAGAQRRTIVFSLLGVTLTLSLALFSLATVERDLRETTALSEELALAEKKFRELAENASELVTLVDAAGQISYVSPSSLRLLGYEPEEFIALDPTALVFADDLAAARVWIEGMLAANTRTGTMNLRYRTKSGDYRWFEVYASILREVDERSPSILFSARDIHERRLAAQEVEQKADVLAQLSITDALTGLLNRRGFYEQAAHRMDAARSASGALALVFMDLDGLKPINDGLGHEAGDQALREAGRILRQVCRGGDFVARLGGDEFCVLAQGMTETGYEHFRQRIESALKQLNDGQDRAFELGFSMGVAFFVPTSDESLDSLLKRADAQMYEHKRDRRQARTSRAASSSNTA
ncbi:MAG TPA: diguanylate cyclase [Polyangiaceae bacterium]|nr:diguanylate cyclase [Polyangiaceae bacterium]